MDIALSVEGVPIRLTAERWFHIVENHDDMAGYYDDILETVENPDVVVRGYGGSLIAARGYGRKRYLAVIYRQVSIEDGFVSAHILPVRLIEGRRYGKDNNLWNLKICFSSSAVAG